MDDPGAAGCRQTMVVPPEFGRGRPVVSDEVFDVAEGGVTTDSMLGDSRCRAVSECLSSQRRANRGGTGSFAG
jgi:hypothetical protein